VKPSTTRSTDLVAAAGATRYLCTLTLTGLTHGIRHSGEPRGLLQDVDKKLDLMYGPPSPRHIVIASYDCAQKLRGYERHFGMLICDESHALKSPTTKRTQFFAEWTAPGGSVRRLIFLTGTPLLSRPIEAFPQARPLHSPQKHYWLRAPHPIATRCCARH
jgi:hypothetical protein